MSEHFDIESIQIAYDEDSSKFHQLVESIDIGIGIYGSNASPIDCNEAAYRLLGLSKEQFLGNSAMDPYWSVVHQDGSRFETYDFPIIQAITNYQPVMGVVMGVSRPTLKDKVWLEVNTYPILNYDSTVKYVICTYKDITQSM